MVERIRTLKEMGIHFAAASGRQYSNLWRLFAPLGDEISYICENGALTFYKGRRLYEDLFPDDLLRDIWKEAIQREGTEITCSMWDVQYLLPKDPAFVHFLSETVGYDCRVVTSGNRWIDFVPFPANKGNGVKALMREMRLAPEECMVFGDEYNDLEMLQSVTYGVAMSYSKKGVRDAASCLTDSVEEVLDRLIETGGDAESLFPEISLSGK